MAEVDKIHVMRDWLSGLSRAFSIFSRIIPEEKKSTSIPFTLSLIISVTGGVLDTMSAINDSGMDVLQKYNAMMESEQYQNILAASWQQ